IVAPRHLCAALDARAVGAERVLVGHVVKAGEAGVAYEGRGLDLRRVGDLSGEELLRLAGRGWRLRQLAAQLECPDARRRDRCDVLLAVDLVGDRRPGSAADLKLPEHVPRLRVGRLDRAAGGRLDTTARWR